MSCHSGISTSVETSVVTVIQAQACTPIAVTLVSPAPVGGGGSSAPQLPVVVASSRALTAADSGRVLQLVNGVTLTVPPGLPPTFAAQLLMPAPQVWAGGVALVAPGDAVSVNGLQQSLRIERTPASTAPWLAWLQRESAADTYSVVPLGATVLPANALTLDADALTLDADILTLE